MGKGIRPAVLRPQGPLAKSPESARTGKRRKAGKTSNIEAGPAAVVGRSARSLEVPPATRADIERTLGVPRWQLFGLRFGPKRKITDVQLFTDARGLALGAFARIDGRRVALDGALFARVAQRQVDLAPAQPAQKAQAEPKKIRRTRPLVAPVPPSPPSPPSTASSRSSSRASDRSEALTLSTPATSRTSHEALALSPEDRAHARWALYCELAARPGHYATHTEVAALAQALGRDIRVVAKLRSSQGLTFMVTDFSGGPGVAAEAEPLTVQHHGAHYMPIVGQLGGPDLPTKNHLHSALTPEEAQTAAAQLTALTKPVPGDGACFFHSIAALIGGDAQQLRAQAVEFMRAHGETSKVPMAAVEGMDHLLSDSYMPHKTSEEYKILMGRIPEPTL